MHEEVTVARAKPDFAAMKTMMDAAPFGASVGIQPPRAAPPAVSSPGPNLTPPAGSIATPLVPAPETQSAPVAVPAAPAAPKTMLLGATMNDPHAEERARQIRDQVLGLAPTAEAAATAPKANLNKTMMMGAEAATAPHVGGGAAKSGSERPTSPPQADQSPLSKSVLAPHSWHPPPSAPVPGGFAEAPAPAPANEPVPAPPAPAPAAPAPAGGPPAGSPGSPALRTMLGMPASDLNLPPQTPGGLGATIPLSGAPPHVIAGLPAPQAGAAAPKNVQKTMLGVAIPGIAPSQDGGPQQGPPPGQQPQSAPPQSLGSSMGLASKQSTMLGVAIPGIAPTQGNAPPMFNQHGQQVYQAQQGQQGQPPQYEQPRMPSQVQNTALGVMVPPEIKIVPRPKTLIDEPMPAAPMIPQKKGVPALVVVAIVIAIVAVAGGGIAFFALRSGGALTAVPQLDENGRESLKIGCTSCPDGTTVALGASSATVSSGAAVLPLPAPLSIGDNDLGVKIERPAGGRHEEVKVHVPVAYRVRADLSTLASKPPAITVRVEATPGSVVTVDDKPLALDPTGRGSYAIDLSKETEGPGEAKTFERKIPFAITPKGGKQETGQLTARTAIVPLALDAPGRWLVTDKTTAAVAGQTRAGTTITIDGQGVPVDDKGHFGVRVELAALGEKPLEITASAPSLAPRIAKVKVTRVATLAEGAKAEDAQSPVAFDVFGADPGSKIGQRVVVEGEVVDARASAGHTVLLVEEKKKCAKGATCLVRLVHGDEDKTARGDTVRAYGRILGSVTASGKTVPDIEATLVMPLTTGKAGK